MCIVIPTLKMSEECKEHVKINQESWYFKIKLYFYIL